MKKRVVVVGLGDYGTRIHIPALKASQKAELVAVSSSDAKDVTKYSQEFGVTGYEDFEKMLDTEKPDFVIQTVYHNQYLPLVEAAAKRGIHILKEKPLAHTLDEAKKIVGIVSSHKIHMLLGVNRRFNPAFQVFNSYISEMKDRYFFEVRYAINFDKPHEGWRGKREIAGGGSIIDFGYHALDVLLWNFGTPKGIIAEWSTKARPTETYDTEDTAGLLLKYKENAFYGTMVLSRVLPRKEYYRVVGSEEIVEYEDGEVRMLDFNGAIHKKQKFNIPKVEVTTQEIDYFCDIIDGIKPPIATAQDHLQHMAVVSAAYLSQQEGKFIDPQSLL